MDSAQLSGNINYENDIQPMPTQYETGMPPGQLPPGNSYQAIKTAMGGNLEVFREPRGVMRILQFVFAICAFATTTGYTNTLTLHIQCENATKTVQLNFSYPFRLDTVHTSVCETSFRLFGNFSSDSQFFVAVGVLSLLYCIAIIIVYVLLNSMYQSNTLLPTSDFVLTVILAVFWLSGSAGWANSLTGLKEVTDPNKYKQYHCDKCLSSSIGNFSDLNISVVLGFLNFFLWASDLWFLYKETPWFKMKQTVDNVGSAA